MILKFIEIAEKAMLPYAPSILMVIMKCKPKKLEGPPKDIKGKQMMHYCNKIIFSVYLEEIQELCCITSINLVKLIDDEEDIVETNEEPPAPDSKGICSLYCIL